MESLKNVTIYTDGGCIDNPGPGGFGVVLIYGKHRREISGGFRLTTNNRMELLAVITGLEALKARCRATVYSDSQYVVNAIEKGWAKRWRAKNWRRNKEEKALNPDLWERLLRLCEFHEVKFKWVRGHAGNRENERCDELARQAASRSNLPIDVVYEDSNSWRGVRS
ncbi:MAG TPA: ribonuclease HI [Acidobacteriota bacterium]|nr:ribonuclease HI [Acidobacteriota bacterium]